MGFTERGNLEFDGKSCANIKGNTQRASGNKGVIKEEMNKVTFKEWNKTFREKIKNQGYEQTLVALSWNILEIKQELENLRKGK